MSMENLILKTVLAALALLPCTITAAAETALAAQPAISPPAAETASPGIVLSPTFTTGIEGGGPTEYLSEIENTQPTVYFFAELEDLNGQTAIHRWKYQDKVMAEVKISVTGPRMKAWSSLSMQPEWTGVWMVEVVNGRGEVISTSTFSYLEPL